MKIQNEYLVLEEEDIHKMKIKKISGHSFVGLIGLDKYKKVGDVLLEMHGFIKSEVDPKWLKRGQLAENIVLKVYERNHKCITYDKKIINYDNFQTYKNCGGLIDIEIPSENTLIEVKSKSMKDYEKICEKQPEVEIYQALYYGYLRGYKEITMEWIFFDKETEEEVFSGKKPTTLMNLKRLSKKFSVDENEIKQLIVKALKIVQIFRNEKRILLSDISGSIAKILNLIGNDLTIIEDGEKVQL